MAKKKKNEEYEELEELEEFEEDFDEEYESDELEDSLEEDDDSDEMKDEEDGAQPSEEGLHSDPSDASETSDNEIFGQESSSSSKKANWYVVHTYSGHENKVKVNIEKIVENRGMQDLVLNIIVPTEDHVEIKN